MYRIIKKVHLWVSVPFGIVISVICVTGLILLFEPQHGPGVERSEFFMDVMRLHRWLFDVPPEKGAMTAGKCIVGVTTIGMVLILLSGIILWAYRLKGGFVMDMKISLRHGADAFLRSLHTAGGAYVALFLLTMALTGLTWSFGWYRDGFNSLFGIVPGSHAAYFIHSGKFGGIITQIIWGISVLIGFTLPLTGYYLWIKRLKIKP